MLYWTMWGALGQVLGALVALVGVGLIYWQVWRFREESVQHYEQMIRFQEESVQHKFDGFELAMKLLTSERMEKFFNDPWWEPDESLERPWMDLEVIGELIDKEYVDPELVFRFRGQYLSGVYEKWRDLGVLGDEYQFEWIEIGPRTLALLRDAHLFWGSHLSKLDGMRP